MHVPDSKLQEIESQGFTIVEDFLDAQTLGAAQEALFQVFPRPSDYFAAPEAYESFSRSQFSGLRLFPYPAWALNRLAVTPDLVDAAERFCGTTDLSLYKVELWAKYAGAIDYDQVHHRDYGNHTLVVPQSASSHRQMTTFILLSDVTEADGPTKVVPQKYGKAVPVVPSQLQKGEMFDKEVSVTGKAGTLFIYKTDVLHRGSNFTAPERSRFALLVDFMPRGLAWTGKMAWPDRVSAHWNDAMVRMTPKERSLFGFPKPGDSYWDAQTLRDVGLRYTGMDMTPYRAVGA